MNYQQPALTTNVEPVPTKYAASVPPVTAVSYTHLDVYKRQHEYQ